MTGRYLIGVDGGTESLRAGVFDLSGRPLAFAASSYQTDYPRPAWAEQDPEDWWRAMGIAVRQACAEAGVSGTDVAALCVDTTCCSVVVLDAKGKPLRPAMIWMDVRAADEAADVAASGVEALKVNGAGQGPVSAEWMVPKALWLKRNQPEVFKQAAYVCEYQDFLNHRMTGRICASLNNASVRWHYDSRGEGFSSALLDAVGLQDLEEKWPRDVLPLGDVVGGLTDEAADHLGLPQGLTVAQGGADAFIGMIGLGVVQPGRMAFITGSSHLLLGLSDVGFHGPGTWGTYADAVIPGLHVIEGGQTSTGSILNWYRRLLGEQANYDDLNAQAWSLPPGAEGLIVLDHFQGNRTPHTDPHSRGVISGLTLKHSPAHIFRAILEGVSFGSELILETMRTNGFQTEAVVVAGGATRSDLWLQIHADISGVPLSLTEVADAPALGSAVLAGVGAGVFPDIQSGAGAMVRFTRTIEPDMAAHAAYRPLYETYRDIYPAMAPILHRQAGVNRKR